MKVFNLADNWYGWDFFNLILIMEEFVINWLDLNENGRLRPTGLVLMKRGVDDQLAWSWRKEISTNNWLGLDERKCLRSTGLILTKRSVCDQLAWSWLKECLRLTGLILMKGCLRSAGLIFTKGCLIWQKGVSMTNLLDLDKKERLWPTGLVLTKRSVCDQLAWSWLREHLRSTGLILTKRSVCNQLA